MTITAREASKLFNSNKLSALADGDYSHVEKVAKGFLNQEVTNFNVCDVYEHTYKRLSQEYRSEYYFKNTIARRRLLGRHSLKTATMLSEFRVGRSKADCVILNGKSTCYEIKSEYDTLNRLEEQLNDYLKLFDEVYVVCSAKNLDSVLKMADERVGVLELTQKNYFSEKRAATPRIEPIDIDLLIKSLRKEEYLELTRRNTGEVPTIPNSKLVSFCKSALKTVEPEKIATSFIEVLKEKRFNDGDLLNVLPSSLINAAISYQFSSPQIEALKSIFGACKESRCISHISEESSLSL
ncbi:sce7726 family protein [Pseudoalteromonas rubra]|uniref:sce7726 family protein n=1 Tax=Pseudoalteromonas rubra TaxID=43658 RepID=UPI001F0BFF2D|nr:sce7726 family protein [Pseudoalteromonas rubra]